MALSPMKVERDYGSVVIDDAILAGIYEYEKYEALHGFDLYESNMPKSSKYVLLLDKDGYLTRK